ncbi:Hypothetical protein A7982_02030 [Minicystis rosea]|nr:Hypothetical protein A7982_02030 [Minicystis rosea]
MSSEPDGTVPPPPEAAAPQADPSCAPGAAAPGWRRWTRYIQLSFLAVGAVAIIGVNVSLIQGGPARTAGDTGSSSSGTSGTTPPLTHGTPTGIEIAEPATSSSAVPDAGPPGEGDEPPPPEKPPAPEKPNERKAGSTVEWAAKRACSTALIDGLSRQIVAEARCLDANAFARVPARRNLESAEHVFLYLDAPARDHLLRALDAHPNRVLKVHSALRTVAQQYLLSRWAADKRCGIQLATRPGESNHETGLALDVGAHAAWRSALEAEGFRWLGAIDRVHFDFVGPGATHHQGLDVHAFQRLWNRNHPDDVIAETGRYDVATELRLKKAPAAGFPVGARCGGKREERAASGAGSSRARAR